MPAGIRDNQFAYAGEPAWHGMGTKINPDATPAVWQKTAKLDYPIQTRSLVMRDANAPDDGRIHFISKNLDGWKAVVRGDTQEVFAVMSDRYQPVQNKEVVEFFADFIAQGRAKMETVGALNGGAKVWALAKLEGGDANIGGVDPVKSRILMMTAHDGTSPTIAKAVQERVVCGNTLAIALGENGKEVRIRHTTKWTKAVAKSAQEQLGMAVERVQEMNSLAAQFAKIKIDGKGRIEFLQKLLNKEPELAGTDLPLDPTPEELDRVLSGVAELSSGDVEAAEIKALGRVGADILEATFSSPGANLVTAKDTFWGMLNGVTRYTDFERGRSQDSRLSNAWFGAGAKMKVQAVEIAQEMTGVRA